MTLAFAIPATVGDPEAVSLDKGKPLFVVGPNGSGKSALLQLLVRDCSGPKDFIAGHRPNTFREPVSDLTISGREANYYNRTSSGGEPSSRWFANYGTAEINVILFDLFAAVHHRDRRVAKAADTGNASDLEAARALQAPLANLSRLFSGAAMPIIFDINERSELTATKGGATYPVTQMSEGERNALLLAARIMAMQAGTLVVIDEPENHLHHAISAPLLADIVKLRDDCYFVLATHDLDLPMKIEGSQLLIVRRCEFQNSNPVKWDVDLLLPGHELDEDLKTDVLGARRKIIYCEGKPHSLDQPLFSLLFPNATVIARDSCRLVERAVQGVRSAQGHTWLSAFGIIDNDGRPQEQLDKLEVDSVFALEVATVECLYYHPTVMERMAQRQFANNGRTSAADMVASARQAIVTEVSAQKNLLAVKIATHRARAAVYGRQPTEAEVQAGQVIQLTLDPSVILKEEQDRLDALIAAKDWAGILKRFGLRKTGAMAPPRRRSSSRVPMSTSTRSGPC